MLWTKPCSLKRLSVRAVINPCSLVLWADFYTACDHFPRFGPGSLMLSSPPGPNSRNTAIAFARSLLVTGVFFQPHRASHPSLHHYTARPFPLLSREPETSVCTEEGSVVRTKTTFKCMLCICNLKPRSAVQLLSSLWHRAGLWLCCCPGSSEMNCGANLGELATSK